MPVIEQLTLGLDLGIGSCGWALVGNRGASGEIVAMGVRTFDVPETDKTRTPTNQLRRQHRSLRRVLRRRRQRMRELRTLFREADLIAGDHPGALKIAGIDPWTCRGDGLDRKLSGGELAVALGHIAKHRGFKSNSKRDRGANAPNDSSDMLKAIEATRDRLKDYRTVGEMFAKHPEYERRKRNRDGDYSRSVLREDQEKEVRLLLDIQRRSGNALATADLERRFAKIAFFQRPLGDSEHLVGPCPFVTGEKRAAKRSYSFELFRFLSRLTAIRLLPGKDRALTPAQIAAASADFGGQRGMTFKCLRKLIDLGDDDRFDGVPPDEEGKRDTVARSGDTAPGTYALRKVLGDAWRTLLATPDKLDRIAFVLTFREDIESIRKGLASFDLEPLILDALMKGVADGEFSAFKGAGHISAKACRAIVPHLKQGLVYSEACTAAGYKHSGESQRFLDPGQALKEALEEVQRTIANPVARKALTEALKQVRAIVKEIGLPDCIHIELARDVGKGKEERDEITRGIEKRNKEKNRQREKFSEVVGSECASNEDLLRFELWREQNGRCVYTDEPIHPNAIVASDNSVQVDHVLPWSRSGDDSFLNKALCFASANQKKRGRTPFEWFEDDESQWNAFVARIETNKAMKGRKKRNYLLRDATVLEKKFRPRNLNDTRYATRLLRDMLARMYPDVSKVHVFARPGRLTNRLRHGWGIQDLKKDRDGNRIDDDRHHALDALIVAATSESALQRLTRAFQEAERRGSHRDFARLDPPWPGFVEEARAKLAAIFVSRAERRRARGKAHDATIRQVTNRDGESVIYERKSIEKLTLTDLERIKDPERNTLLIETLRKWMEKGKPADEPPLWRTGGMTKEGTKKEGERQEPIRKVRLRTNKKPDVLVRDGATDRGEMVRMDVFRKKNRKGAWEFFLVPIYPHQVADTESWPSPPNRAIQGGKDEADWSVIGDGHEFCWSLHPMTYLELVKPDGEVVEGYLRSLDRNTGAFTISPQHTKNEIRKGIGTRTLKAFRKFYVDRLGRRYEVEREKRTWHGAVCT